MMETVFKAKKTTDKNNLLIMKPILVFWTLSLSVMAMAQDGVGIGTTRVHPSAALHVQPPDNNKGLLIPRLTTHEKNNITDPADGLIVYDSIERVFHYYDGTVVADSSIGWTPLVPNPAKEDLDLNNHTVQNLANGTADDDAVNYDQLMAAAVPSGTIIMWEGTTEPTGWKLCNGQNGTPDLTDRFVLGAALGDYGPGGGGMTTIAYNEEELYTPDPTGCSEFQYLWSYEVGGPHGDCEVNRWIPVNNEAEQSCGDSSPNNCVRNCSSTPNPDYYEGNPNCRTDAIALEVVTEKPAYYKLAFIMKE